MYWPSFVIHACMPADCWSWLVVRVSYVQSIVAAALANWTGSEIRGGRATGPAPVSGPFAGGSELGAGDGALEGALCSSPRPVKKAVAAARASRHVSPIASRAMRRLGGQPPP